MSVLPASQVFEGASAVVRLRELGVTPTELSIAVQTAELERRSCSLLEPSTAPGYKAWAAGFRALAEQLVVRGWVKTETQGLPRLLNPDTRIAIALVNGDEGTGRQATGSGPKSKAPRGAQTVLLVRSNQVQLELFPGSREFRPLPVEAEQITWWLLMYSDGHDLIRAELSLPIGIGEDRRLAVWEERILIPVEPNAFDRADDEEPPLELEINVRPRT